MTEEKQTEYQRQKKRKEEKKKKKCELKEEK